MRNQKPLQYVCFLHLSFSSHSIIQSSSARMDNDTRAFFLFQAETSVKINGIGNDSFPSMGIYVVSRDAIIKLLTEHFPMANDLRSEIIPGAISLEMKASATCLSYFTANPHHQVCVWHFEQHLLFFCRFMHINLMDIGKT